MRSGVRIGLGLLLIAAMVSGCGVRGSLEHPTEAKAERDAEKAALKDGDGKKPHKDFVLDDLIR